MEYHPFDPASLLETPEDVAIFLDEAALEGDPVFLTKALGIAARARGMTMLAKETGLSREALYRSLSESGDPRLSTLAKALKAMGLRLAIAVA
jgi:probable addiction module antidote protein